MDSLLNELKSVVSDASKGLNDEESRRRCATECASLLTRMKRANRELYLKCHQEKMRVMDAKHSLDAHFLKLQNLRYEKDHLLQEIARCKSFETPELTRIRQRGYEPDKGDVHAKVMSELTSELMERKEQSEEKGRLRKRKKDMESVSVQKEKLVEHLPRALEEMRKIIEPLGDFMPKNAKVRSTQLLKSAKKLPLPLFILFSQMSGFEDAFETGLSFAISCGDLKRQASENEAEDTKRPDQTSGDAVDVTFTLDHNKSVVLRFEFLPALRVVTVRPLASTANDDDEQWDMRRALHDLFLGDNGRAMPSASARHMQVALNGGSAKRSCGRENAQTGVAFRWTQWLAGLQSADRSDPDPSEMATQQIVRRLHSRLQSRTKLQRLLDDLASLKPFEYAYDAEASPMFPEHILSNMTVWKEVSTQAARNRTFQGVLTFQKKYLRFVVKVGADYPIRAPVFALLSRRDNVGDEDDGTDVNDSYLEKNKTFLVSDLDAIEAEVNLHYEEILPRIDDGLLLRYQLLRLRMCFDVLVMASNKSGGAKAARLRKGRDRRLALKFDFNEPGMVHR